MSDFVGIFTSKIKSFPKFEKDYDDSNMEPFNKAYGELIDLVIGEVNRVGIDNLKMVKTQTQNIFNQFEDNIVGDFNTFWNKGVMPGFDVPKTKRKVSFFTYLNLGFILKDILYVLIGIVVFGTIIWLVSWIKEFS